MEHTLMKIQSGYITELSDLRYDEAHVVIEQMRSEVTYFTIDDFREYFTFYFRSGKYLIVHREDGPLLAQALFPNYEPPKRKPQPEPERPEYDVYYVGEDEDDV